MAISSRTESRKRKLELLKESLNLIIELLLLNHKHREKIHIANYRSIVKKLKDMLKMAKTSKLFN